MNVQELLQYVKKHAPKEIENLLPLDLKENTNIRIMFEYVMNH